MEKNAAFTRINFFNFLVEIKNLMKILYNQKNLQMLILTYFSPVDLPCKINDCFLYGTQQWPEYMERNTGLKWVTISLSTLREWRVMTYPFSISKILSFLKQWKIWGL